MLTRHPTGSIAAASPTWLPHLSRTSAIDYCLSNTNTAVNGLPSAFVPLIVVVMVLPPFETTVRAVDL